MDSEVMVAKVRYCQIDAAALKEELIKRYEFQWITECRFLDMGMNDIYRVKADQTTYYLRLSLAHVHEQKDYEEEMAILLRLKQHGIRVAVPVVCKDGTYVWKVSAPEGMRYAVLLTEALRNDRNNENQQFYELGEMIAKMHQISDQEQITVTRPPIDFNALQIQPLEQMKPYLSHRRNDYVKLSEKSEQLVKQITERLEASAPYYGFCHGDLHSGNIYFADGHATIFDFDCMGYGYRAYDLCVYAWNESYQNPDYLKSEQWRELLNGYQSIRTLSEEEIQLIPAFMALRQIWMIGLHAKVMDQNAGCCWYNDSYFDEQIQLFERYYAMMNE